MTTNIEPLFPSTGDCLLDELLTIAYAERYEPRDRLQRIVSVITTQPSQQAAVWLYDGYRLGELVYQSCGPKPMSEVERRDLAMHYELIETPLYKPGANLARRLAELESENDNLRKALTDDQMAKTLLTDFSIKNGINMQIEGSMAGVMALVFADQFRQANGVNYVEMTMRDKAGLELIVTIQKRDGKTPHQLRQIAEDRYNWVAKCIDNAEFAYSRLMSGDTKEQLDAGIDEKIKKEAQK